MITNISMAAHSATCAAAKRRLIGSECSFADYLRSPHHERRHRDPHPAAPMIPSQTRSSRAPSGGRQAGTPLLERPCAVLCV